MKISIKPSSFAAIPAALAILALASASAIAQTSLTPHSIDLSINNLNSFFSSVTGTGGAYIYFETNAWLIPSGSTGTTYANGNGSGVANASNAAFTGSIGSNPITMNWNSQTGNNALYMSDPINVNTLTSPISIGFAGAVRMYVSLGSQLAVTGSNSILGEIGSGTYGVGAPNPTNINDPNYNVRWDVYEITYQGGTVATDQMNLTAINMTGVPMSLQTTGTRVAGTGPSTFSATARTVLNTIPSSNDYQALVGNLKTLANSNTAQNASGWGALPANWYVTATVNTSAPAPAFTSSFVRIVGPNAGANIAATTTTSGGTTFMAPAAGLGGQAVIGPSPTFDSYVQYVNTNAIATPITTTVTPGTVTYSALGSATTVNWTGGAYSANWMNGATPYSGTMFYKDGPAIQVTSTITSTSGTGVLTVIIPQAADVTTGGENPSTYSSYLQSKTIYDGNFNSYGPIFIFNDITAGTTTTYLDFNAVNALYGGDMQGIQNQISHDLTSGYVYGFIGAAFQPEGYGGTSINDMGSGGWRELAKGGTFTDLFQELWSDTQQFFHQWANTVFANSETVYGFPYSDYFQNVLLNNTQQAVGDSTYNMTSWELTILPDAIPEAGTAALMLSGVALLYVFRRRSKA